MKLFLWIVGGVALVAGAAWAWKNRKLPYPPPPPWYEGDSYFSDPNMGA